MLALVSCVCVCVCVHLVPGSVSFLCNTTTDMDGWVCVHTDVHLSVPNLNEGACVQGVSTLTFVFPAAENYADEKIFRIHCKQCKVLKTYVNDQVQVHQHRDYLGNPSVPIVPNSDNFTDLDAFDVRYREKASAAEQGELSVSLPENVLAQLEAESRTAEVMIKVAVHFQFEVQRQSSGLYSGYPRSGKAGNGTRAPDAYSSYDGPFWSNGDRPLHIFTFNEPLCAGTVLGGASGIRTWLPSIDLLDSRCTYNITIQAGNGLVPVCSGNLVNKRSVKNGKTVINTFEFKIADPIPPHAVGLAIGEFVVVADKFYPSRVTYFAPNWGVDETTACIQNCTKYVAKAIHFFEEIFDCQIPMGCHNVVFVNDPPTSRPLVGSHSASMTVLSRDCLLPKSVRSSKLINFVDLAAELAMGVVWNWFGVLANVKHWQDSWLSIGLANYMVDLFIKDEFGEDLYRVRLNEKMERVRDAAKRRSLRSLIAKNNEEIFELGPRHSSSPFASRASMTIHAVVVRLNLAGHVSFLSLLRQWLKDTTANRRESHLDLYGTFKADPEVRQRIALPPSSETGAGGAEASGSKPLAAGKLQPDVCDSSIPFIRKLAFLSGCQRVLDDAFIRHWLQKNSIPMFTADFAYYDRANQVELAITQAAGTNFEGDMVVSIHQGVDLVDLHSIGIYSGVAEATQKIDCKKKDRTKRQGLHVRFIEFDPKMQLIHDIKELKTPPAITKVQFYGEMLMNTKGKNDGDLALQYRAIKNLAALPSSNAGVLLPDIKACEFLLMSLDPNGKYSNDVKERAVEAVAEWQNLHTPNTYAASNRGDCGGLTHAKLWPSNNPAKKGSNGKATGGRGPGRGGKGKNAAKNKGEFVAPKPVTSAPEARPVDGWYGLHALIAAFRAYFCYYDASTRSYEILPNDTTLLKRSNSLRNKFIESLSKIRDSEGCPPPTLYKFFSSLLKHNIDAPTSGAEVNVTYIASLLRALGKVSKEQLEVKKTLDVYQQYINYQAVLPCPYRSVLVACIRGIADMESCGAKPASFEFHSYAMFSPSSRVRQAAYESIMRVYLIGNHGDGFQTVGWLVERLSPTSDMFEASASSRRVVVDILLKIINGGIADSAFKEILLSDSEILHNGEKKGLKKAFVEKLWECLNQVSCYDWYVRGKMYSAYKALFSYKTPEPFEGVDDEREDDDWADPLKPPSKWSKQTSQSTRYKSRCLMSRIQPMKSPRVVGKEYGTPLLSPRAAPRGTSAELPAFGLGEAASQSTLGTNRNGHAGSSILQSTSSPRTGGLFGLSNGSSKPVASPNAKTGTKLKLRINFKRKREE